MTSKILLLFIFFGMIVFICGCPGVLPGSRPYQPLPQWEAHFFSQATRNVFPSDVRQNLEKYKKVLVVWTGVITNIDSFHDDVGKVTSFTAEHHYFDWIEDFGIQRERYFLSPRGEGEFVVSWRADAPEDQIFLEQFKVGDLLIAYGYPSMIKNEVIGIFPTQNIRSIKPRWYRMDVLDYGRPGEAVILLKTPF